MKEVIHTAVVEKLRALGLPEASFVVEHPGELVHGDYACNVAMVVAKEAGKAPRVIAEQLLAALEGVIPQVANIEVAGPGFLNFHLSRDFFSKEITGARETGRKWGSNDSWGGKTVIVEYTDPNPFKELHIGHVVPNALGEVLARLFMNAGADTKRVTFQGDVGMHVAKAMYGLQQLGATPSTIDAAMLGKAYANGAAAFEENENIKADITLLNKVIYTRSDETVNELYDAGKAASLAYFEEGYTVLGSQFDHNFFESVTGPVGLALVQQHVGTIFKESEGAIIFEGEKYGLHTRVFVNKEGLPTYETKDVGLVACKHEWCPFDLAITVTGTEQQEYFKVTTKASELIQPEIAGKVELVANGMLRLTEGKMSSRTGNVLRALDMVADVQAAAADKMGEHNAVVDETVAQQVAVAAIKYTILKIAPGKDIVFDKKQALSFEGDSGPYLQYTYARIVSLLEKASGVGVLPRIEHAPVEPYEIEKILYRFPEVTATALAERAPHQVVTYLTQLAGMFNTFYVQEKIADSEDEYAPYKAAVAEAVSITLKNGLWVLGIEAPERM